MSGAGATTQGSGLSFRLGRFPVHMPWSSLLGIALISYFWLGDFTDLVEDQTEAYLLTGIFALLFYATILGHELAHAVVADAAGYPVSGITLWWLGGFTAFQRTRPSAVRDGLIAAAGPFSSLLIGIGCGLLATAEYDDLAVHGVAYALAWSNIFLAVYNALPGLPLDGGSVLRALVWAVTRDETKGTVVAAWAGRVVAILVIVLPLWLVFRGGGTPDLLWVVFTVSIGAFLWQGATHALEGARLSARVAALSARRLARSALLVAADLPLAEALRRAQEAGAGGLVVLDPQGRAQGVVQPAAVDAVPGERRPWVPVSSVSVSIDPQAVLAAGLEGEALIGAMQAHPSAHYLVLDPDARWAGVLSTSDVEAALARPG